MSRHGKKYNGIIRIVILLEHTYNTRQNKKGQMTYVCHTQNKKDCKCKAEEDNCNRAQVGNTTINTKHEKTADNKTGSGSKT